jgi:hypothetical protein
VCPARRMDRRRQKLDYCRRLTREGRAARHLIGFRHAQGFSPLSSCPRLRAAWPICKTPHRRRLSPSRRSRDQRRSRSAINGARYRRGAAKTPTVRQRKARSLSGLFWISSNRSDYNTAGHGGNNHHHKHSADAHNIAGHSRNHIPDHMLRTPQRRALLRRCQDQCQLRQIRARLELQPPEQLRQLRLMLRW